MAPELTLELACQIVGVAILAATVPLLLWGRLWDRARGRRRCPRCWYDMAGVPGLTCPECGRTARHEQALMRTRRRRWTIGAAMLLLGLAHVTWRAPDVWERGWVAAVPTTILIPVVTTLEPNERPFVAGILGERTEPGVLAVELSARAVAGQLWDWEWRWLIRRVGVVRTRPKWPVDHHWTPDIRLPDWLRASIYKTVADVGPVVRSQVHVNHLWRDGMDVYLLPGTREVPVEIEIAGYGKRWPPQTRWSGVLQVPVEAVGTLTDAVAPDASAELDEAIRTKIAINFRTYPHHHVQHFTMELRLDLNAHPRLQRLAPGFAIEFLRDGKPADVPVALSLPAGSDQTIRLTSSWIRGLQPWAGNDPSEIDRWSLRVRGDAEAALRTHRGSVYWDGELVIPVSEIEVVEARLY